MDDGMLAFGERPRIGEVQMVDGAQQGKERRNARKPTAAASRKPAADRPGPGNPGPVLRLQDCQSIAPGLAECPQGAGMEILGFPIANQLLRRGDHVERRRIVGKFVSMLDQGLRELVGSLLGEILMDGDGRWGKDPLDASLGSRFGNCCLVDGDGLKVHARLGCPLERLFGEAHQMNVLAAGEQLADDSRLERLTSVGRHDDLRDDGIRPPLRQGFMRGGCAHELHLRFHVRKAPFEEQRRKSTPMRLCPASERQPLAVQIGRRFNRRIGRENADRAIEAVEQNLDVLTDRRVSRLEERLDTLFGIDVVELAGAADRLGPGSAAHHVDGHRRGAWPLGVHDPQAGMMLLHDVLDGIADRVHDRSERSTAQTILLLLRLCRI
jgi:hypothetical protein